MALTLGKSQRLKSARTIKEIFDSRRSISAFPLRVIWARSEDTQTKAAFSVSKKGFKNAVDRNRVKRLMRESYRLQRDEILGGEEDVYNMVFIYADSRMPDYEKMYSSMGALLKKIVEKVSKNSSDQ